MKRKDSITSPAPCSAATEASATAIGLWSQRGISHAEICARLHERSDLECFVAIRLLDGPPDATAAHETGCSAANQLISRLAARLVDTKQILRLLEPHLKQPVTTPLEVGVEADVKENAGSPLPPPANTAHKHSTASLPALLELNALAVEGWVRVTKAARAELN